MVKKIKCSSGVIGTDSRGLDQFFTKPDVALGCVKILDKITPLNTFNIILEPSFGEGAFVDAINKKYKGTLLFYDIDANNEEHRKDFLKNISYIPKESFHIERQMESPNSRILTIGNPPFGKNSSLAVAFFNQASRFSDVIAFIVPKTFCKDSLVDKLDRNFFLIHENVIEDDGFIFKAKTYNVPCVYQIWFHYSFFHHIGKEQPTNSLRNLKKTKIDTPSDFIFVTPQDNPDFAIRRVGVNAGKIFTSKANECSKESHFFIKCKIDKVNVLSNLKSLVLEKSECKYNTAGCPSISKNELCIMYNSQFGVKNKVI